MYRVVVYPEAADQLRELPASVLADYARVLDAVEIAPWNGPPHNERNPDGALRRWSYGPGDAGQVLHLVRASMPVPLLPRVPAVLVPPRLEPCDHRAGSTRDGLAEPFPRTWPARTAQGDSTMPSRSARSSPATWAQRGRTRGAAVLLMLGALTAGCAARSSITDVPPAASGTDVTGSNVVGVVEPSQPLNGLPQPVPIELPGSAVEFFRSLESTCAQYSALIRAAGQGDPPVIEPDRFRGAVLVREIDSDTALVEDGRGTRLVVDGWRTMGVILAGSGRPGDPLPDPYRLACPPDASG